MVNYIRGLMAPNFPITCLKGEEKSWEKTPTRKTDPTGDQTHAC